MDLPFGRYPLTRAYGIDAVRKAVIRRYRSVTIELASNEKPPTWHNNGISLGPMLVDAGHLDTPMTITSEPSGNAVLLVFARAGTATFQCGKNEYAVDRCFGAVFSPEQAITFSVMAGFSSLTVGLDYRMLNETLQALSGVYSAKPLEFDGAFDIRTPHGAELFRLLDFITKTIDQDPSPLGHPIVLASLYDAFFMSFLYGHPHNHQALLQQGALSPSTRAIRTAEAYLDANAGKAITMTELQSVTGVSVRTIQVGFKAKRGCSPMAFLKERRLLLAKTQLEKATPGMQVSGVAFGCGFGHLGRFSRDYFKRFGEKPSDTLERALRKSHGITSRA